MEIINITEEQKNKLCTELARLVSELRKNNNVECIYYKTFIGLLGYGKNVLDVGVICQGNVEKEDKECARGYEHYTEEHNLREYGVKIHIFMDNANLYTATALNEAETIRQIDLFNSTILFDRTGKYTEIKEKLQKEEVDDIYFYRDLAEIVPPIDETLNKEIETLGMNGDSAVVKEFPKSRIFKYNE